MLGMYLQSVRSRAPLIHNITNYVTVNDVANAILACGANPVMADDPQDAREITAICGGLNLNIGTLNQRTIPAMFAAGEIAAQLGHPIVLDPVGAGASTIRTQTALDLMRRLPLTAIRGNISEIKTLAVGSGSTKGVDADAADAVCEENLDASVAFVRSFAACANCVVAVTGAMDLVSDGKRTFVIRNGKSQMSRITGTGCQLSGVMTAFLSANPQNALEAAAAAVCMMGLAGEIGFAAMQPGQGNASYRTHILDAINCMTPKALDEGANYEIRI